MKLLILGSWRRNAIAITILVVFYAAYGTLIALFQERIVYQPFAQDFETCSEFAQARKITFDGTRMYYKNNGPTIAVIYHGNGGSACDRGMIASIFDSQKISYLVPEYAGYSNATSTPSHDAIKKDAEHVIDFLKTRGFTHIIVVGESIGTGVASYHASIHAPDRLILISPFTSLLDLARGRFWFYPVSVLVDNAFDNAKLLSAYKGPVLVIHGRKDDLIPFRLGKELFGAIPSDGKIFFELPGAGHNDVFAYPETYEQIREFSVRR